MRSMILFLIVASAPAVADNWWQDTDKSMPELLEDGYQVVGFSADTDEDRSVMKYGTKLRYVLVKGTSAALCVELIQSGRSVRQACFLSKNSQNEN